MSHKFNNIVRYTGFVFCFLFMTACHGSLQSFIKERCPSAVKSQKALVFVHISTGEDLPQIKSAAVEKVVRRYYEYCYIHISDEYSEPDYRIAWIKENPQVSYSNYLKSKDPPYSDSDLAVIEQFHFSLTPAYYAVSRRGKLLGQFNGFAEIEGFEEDISRFLLGYVVISNKAGAK